MNSLVPGLRHQKHLETVVSDLFGGAHNILYNVRKEAGILNPETGKCLELDIWIPHLKLAFEFQDPHHYVTTWESNIPLEDVQVKDHIKYKAMKARGETLVLVPCWWDGKLESLVSTIRLYRPELLSHHSSSSPISSIAPAGFFLEKGIPDVGELMLASFSLSPKFKMKSWWMGEKYDGIRACWHPVHSLLYSRQGTILSIPEQCSKKFPGIFVDSEIWCGRGYFPETRLFSALKNWESLRIIAFDNADPQGREQSFEDRYTNVIHSISFSHPFIIFAPRVRIQNRQHMVASTRSILGDGGEGVITRRPNSVYEIGRSPSLIKFKASRADREALVVGQDPDGSFQLKLPEGTIFSARVPDLVSAEVQPTTGDIVTFSYEKYSRNVIPVKPKIYRIRDDVAWRDVISNFASSASDQLLDGTQRAGLSFSRYPMGYWKIQRGKNIRNFFEKFSKSKQLNPLLPESWYSISKEDILSVKGGTTIVNQYGGSVVQALLDVFPEIGFDVTKFHRIIKGYWDKKEHRRRFLEKIALKLEFDPLVVENWYSVSRRSIERSKNGKTVLAYYKGSLAKALVDLFPENKFECQKFQYIQKEERKDWKSEEDSHRRFFDCFASKFEFDPLVSKNWYSVEISDICKEGGQSLLNKYYQGSLVRALQTIYPSLSFDFQKFKKVPRAYWEERENRKQLFMKFAESKKFEAKEPQNWYSVQLQNILEIKGGGTIMRIYNNSLANALVDVFPDIGLDKSKFGKAPQKYWAEKENRINFMNKVAEIEGFNAREKHNWKRISSRFLFRFKGGRSVLSYHNNSVTKAIEDLFD